MDLDSFADVIGLKVCKKSSRTKAKGTFIMYVFRMCPGDYIVVPFVLPKRTVRYIAQVCLISSCHLDFQNLSHRVSGPHVSFCPNGSEESNHCIH